MVHAEIPVDVEKAEAESPIASAGTSPTIPQENFSNLRAEDVDEDFEKDIQRKDDDLTRTKSAVSIAETFSLPHEIAFVTVICMAQFLTRMLISSNL